MKPLPHSRAQVSMARAILSAARRWLAPICFLAWMAAAWAGEPILIRYPAFSPESEARFQPYLDLLREALERTSPKYGPAELQPSPQSMTETRYLQELLLGNLDVAWSSTSEERERLMRPVRIPLDKGLLGYRVALIPAARQSDIAGVRDLAGLRRLRVGQGLGWGDVRLYRHNGIQVTEAGYELLFAMLDKGRFDLFPRGIGEVFSELDNRSAAFPGLAVDKSLLIYYPWPYYFFFNRERGAELAKRVEEGLRLMLKDGSYDRFFQQHYGASIRRADLDGRTLIRLDNPMLPKKTPLDDARLWYQPASRAR
ncbi:substrate-binding periplasmic protein [Chromobacterium violaceum]|uniref:substrate-binding periplasmic protein n=1 Tax=Chromobacterium violaceum TaxID=536 RepID=UPI001E63FC2F|nr:transporter substrate-binding domain-containing protein [Chromobacterium violaceum]